MGRAATTAKKHLPIPAHWPVCSPEEAIAKVNEKSSGFEELLMVWMHGGTEVAMILQENDTLDKGLQRLGDKLYRGNMKGQEECKMAMERLQKLGVQQPTEYFDDAGNPLQQWKPILGPYCTFDAGAILRFNKVFLGNGVEERYKGMTTKTPMKRTLIFFGCKNPLLRDEDGVEDVEDDGEVEETINEGATSEEDDAVEEEESRATVGGKRPRTNNPPHPSTGGKRLPPREELQQAQENLDAAQEAAKQAEAAAQEAVEQQAAAARKAAAEEALARESAADEAIQSLEPIVHERFLKVTHKARNWWYGPCRYCQQEIYWNPEHRNVNDPVHTHNSQQACEVPPPKRQRTVPNKYKQ